METLSGAMQETIEEAAQLIAENFEDDEMLSISEAAVNIGSSEASVYLWIKDQKMPSERIGGKVYVRKSVAEIVKELRDLYGRSWHENATWGAE